MSNVEKTGRTHCLVSGKKLQTENQGWLAFRCFNNTTGSACRMADFQPANGQRSQRSTGLAHWIEKAFVGATCLNVRIFLVQLSS